MYPKGKRHHDTADLRLREITLFLELIDTGSIRELARRRNLQPGQVSKMIRSLERKFGTNLLDRSSTGVQLTAKAAELRPQLQKIHDLQVGLSDTLGASTSSDVLSIASTTLISNHFLPGVVADLTHAAPELRTRLIDLSPAMLVPVAMRGAFQVCVHSRELEWPRTWTSVRVGELKWHLCARKGHPLARKRLAREALKYPFVYPVYWTHEGLRYGEDQCPIPISKRVRGHETTTATSALELVMATDHVGFLPDVVTHAAVQRRQIDTIEISSWKPVTQPLYLTVKADLVKKSTFERLQEICARRLRI